MKRKQWYLAALMLIIIAVLIVMPAEKTLGAWIKWVYLHASFDAVGLIAFYTAAILAVGYLVSARQVLYQYSTGLWKAGTILWSGGWAIGTVLGIVLWGGWTTAEPRNLLAPAILLLGIGGWLVSANLSTKRSAAIALICGAVLIWSALNFTGRVIHPLNPIGSGTALMKASYATLMAAMALLGWELTKWLAGTGRR
ncbi:MAG: hypothetical protein GX058_01060 [Firmicutes bacterium]|nr:hypothetical protein [Bacillota bacterium]